MTGTVGKRAQTTSLADGLNLPWLTRPRADDAAREIGVATQVADYPGQTTHPIPIFPKTHPLGNSAITYRFATPVASAVVTVITNGDGTVNRLGVGVDEK